MLTEEKRRELRGKYGYVPEENRHTFLVKLGAAVFGVLLVPFTIIMLAFPVGTFIGLFYWQWYNTYPVAQDIYLEEGIPFWKIKRNLGTVQWQTQMEKRAIRKNLYRPPYDTDDTRNGDLSYRTPYRG